MPFPDIQYCIVCEHVRQEIGNKLSVLGFYGVTPYVNIVVSQWGSSIALLFILGAGPATGAAYNHSHELLNPDGSVLIVSPTSELRIEENPSRGILGFAIAAPFQREGIHTFRLTVDNEPVYETQFSVVRHTVLF